MKTTLVVIGFALWFVVSVVIVATREVIRDKSDVR
jgi:hypothetical protein